MCALRVPVAFGLPVILLLSLATRGQLCAQPDGKPGNEYNTITVREINEKLSDCVHECEAGIPVLRFDTICRNKCAMTLELLYAANIEMTVELSERLSKIAYQCSNVCIYRAIVDEVFWSCRHGCTNMYKHVSTSWQNTEQHRETMIDIINGISPSNDDKNFYMVMGCISGVVLYVILMLAFLN